VAQRRHHYERAFEAYLRARRTPYVAVDEAKKSLLPPGASHELVGGEGAGALKSFDFVVYGQETNLLVEVKGRRLAARKTSRPARLECWVTRDDLRSLRAWERLFGDRHEGAFVFVYACDEQPEDALFEEVFEHGGVWYTLRAIGATDYAGAMKTRSASWGTVDLRAPDFEALSRPFGAPGIVPVGAERAPARAKGAPPPPEAMFTPYA